MERASVICPHCQGIVHYKRCRNCTHFTPYYFAQEDGGYHRIDRGQCFYPRLKTKMADDYCVNWCGDLAAKGD